MSSRKISKLEKVGLALQVLVFSLSFCLYILVFNFLYCIHKSRHWDTWNLPFSFFTL
jgi:hypothetical protein